MHEGSDGGAKISQGGMRVSSMCRCRNSNFFPISWTALTSLSRGAAASCIVNASTISDACDSSRCARQGEQRERRKFYTRSWKTRETKQEASFLFNRGPLDATVGYRVLSRLPCCGCISFSFCCCTVITPYIRCILQ